MNRWAFRAALRVGALAAAVVAAAPAYYHFVHFVNSESGEQRLVEKFDLSALLDERVYFYVSRQEMPRLAANDSFDGLLSQIRQALAVWDGVPASRLRLGFGGLVDGPVPGATPAGEIIFAELPPGVIGLGGPVTRGAATADGFVPIVRSQVVLSNNLVDGSRPRASFSELFFSTVVHEIGHALGLQHTLASSAMSTDITRSTTRALPLGADDIAGLAALYPTAAFRRFTGAIEGRVTFTRGDAVALASVGAIHAGGAVVTALTDPDGRYRLDGLPAGEYLLYVQPLPPPTQEGLGPANIVSPLADGRPLAASGAFRAVFFGGTVLAGESPRVRVRAGSTESGVDFRVAARASAAIANVTTYSFPGNGAPGVHPAFLNLTSRDDFLVATGQGLTASLGRLGVEALGRALRVAAPAAYSLDARFVRLDFPAAPFAGLGPVNLLFRLPDDFYLLPSAFHLTAQAAPVIHWVAPAFAGGRAAWRVRGERFELASEVWFDGERADILDFDAAAGELLVAPPPGPPGHRAVVTVANPDGQSSNFTLPDGNVLFVYASGNPSSYTLRAPPATAGSDVLVEVVADGGDFLPGRVALGFASSDIVTRDIEVASPGRLRAVVTVRAGVPPGRYAATIASGLGTAVLREAFEVSADGANALGARPRLRYRGLVNSATGSADVSPGTLASLYGEGLAGGGPTRVTFNGVEARLLAVNATQVNLAIPESVAPGAVELRVSTGEGESEPMLVRLDRASPGLFGVLDAAGRTVPAAAPGARFSLLATGLGAAAAGADRLTPAASTGVQVLWGDWPLAPAAVRRLDIPGLWAVEFDAPDTPAARVGLRVDGRRSNELPVAGPNDRAIGPL